MSYFPDFIYEVRNNLNFEAAEIYVEKHPEKTTPERLKEWSRNLTSRIYALRPFLEEAWRANGEYCSDAIGKTVTIKKLSDADSSFVLYPPHNQEKTKVCQVAMLLRAEEKLDRLRKQALWKLNEAIIFPEKTYPDETLSHKHSLDN